MCCLQWLKFSCCTYCLPLMRNLVDELSQACSRALQHRQRYPARPISPRAKEVLDLAWQRLLREGQRLSSSEVPDSLSDGFCKNTAFQLLQAISRGLEVASCIRPLIPSDAARMSGTAVAPVLCCAAGNPGRSGCASIDGAHVLWHRLVGSPWSAATAMDRLGLHLLGLPAARLPSGISIPGASHLHLLARGGPSYHSCAVLWRVDSPFVFAEITSVGSNCRCWVSVSFQGALVACVGFVAMPTQGGTDLEQKWHAELEGLRADLHILRSSYRSETRAPKILILGDWNVQPSCLGGGPDPRPLRDTCLSGLNSDFSLILLNPSLAGDHARQVMLPYRQSQVSIRTCDTHYGAGQSRAIDLALCAQDTEAQVFIHNGLHCAQSAACSWAMCAGFGKSDHFLLEARVSLDTLSSETEAGDNNNSGCQFPRQWHMTTRWQEAFIHVEPAITALVALVVCLRVSLDAALDCRKRFPAVSIRRWFLDCVCWLQWLLACVARDGWVHPSSSATNNTAPARNAPALAAHSNSTTEVRSLLRSFLAASADLPVNVVQKCFKLLRKPKVQLPPFMQAAGVPLSRAGTHRAWCDKLRAQCAGPTLPSQEVELRMCRAAASLLGRAWAARSQHAPDIFEPEVCAVLSGWKSSTAIPPDLIPRAAFVCNNTAWRTLVWRLCQLAGPGSWALRPSLWRWASLGTTYKKGDVHDCSSWRLLFIRSQMGLLQEGLLAIHLRPAIWGSLCEGQSGYMRSTDDPLMVLHDLSMDALSCGRCFFAVLGDFEKAFPSTWREDILCLAAKCPGVAGGVLHLLGDALAWDAVHVLLAGSGVINICQGLPEGGCLGPILYTLLPDSLARILAQESCGVAMQPGIPLLWQGHQWSGQGTPRDDWTRRILHSLPQGPDLPSCAALRRQQDLEASAARALDLNAADRLAILLHADDPVLLASSWGELCRMLLIVERWAPLHGACFHVGADKAVLMRIGFWSHYPHHVSSQAICGADVPFNLQLQPQVAWMVVVPRGWCL